MTSLGFMSRKFGNNYKFPKDFSIYNFWNNVEAKIENHLPDNKNIY